MIKNSYYNIEKLCYGHCDSVQLYSSIKNNLHFVERLQCVSNSKVHNGCVNTISWNEEGRLILSGSDDLHLAISDPFTQQVIFKHKTNHRSNIFSAKFMPMSSDQHLISSSADGMIYWTDVNNPLETINFNYHRGPAYELATIVDDSNVFLSCGNDGCTRSFDLRANPASSIDNFTKNILVKCKGATLSIASNHMHSCYFMIGCSDGVVRMYDRRMIQQQADELNSVEKIVNVSLCGKAHRITSLSYNQLATKLLVSYSAHHVYLFNLNAKSELRRMESLMESSLRGTGEGEGDVTPIRRLRLRGDWSDTGPSSRPLQHTPIDTPTDVERPISFAMQRISQIMTNWFESRIRPNQTHSQSVEQNQITGQNQLEEQSLATAQNPLDDQNHSTALQNVTTDMQNVSADINQLNDLKYDYVRAAEPSQSDNCNNTLCSGHSSISSHIDDAAFTECDTISDNILTNSDCKMRSNIVTSIYIDSALSDSLDQIDNVADDREAKNYLNLSVAKESISLNENLKCESSRIHDYNVNKSPIIFDDYQNRNIQLESDFYNSVQSESISKNNCQPESLFKNSKQMTSTSKNSNQYVSSSNYTDQLESLNNTGDVLNESSSSFSSYHSVIGELDPEFNRFQNEDFMKCFKGHRNTRTVIKEATFWGDRYVISGSDCGHIFIWDADTTRLVALLPADRHVVNCVQPHHQYPLLVSSGIDYDVKLWMPTASQPQLDADMADEVIRRNRLMLEQTRDTVTVPASFIIRLFALLNRPTNRNDEAS